MRVVAALGFAFGAFDLLDFSHRSVEMLKQVRSFRRGVALCEHDNLPTTVHLFECNAPVTRLTLEGLVLFGMSRLMRLIGS